MSVPDAVTLRFRLSDENFIKFMRSRFCPSRDLVL
jgi:hypothetical protein